jgi:diguanylate cyclase (GGDEF)-like protein
VNGGRFVWFLLAEQARNNSNSPVNWLLYPAIYVVLIIALLLSAAAMVLRFLRKNFLTRVFFTPVVDRRRLHRYVLCVTLVCLAGALSADVANQLIFFEDWPTALRSWAITTVITVTAAAFFSFLLARAQLELYRAKSLAEDLSRTDQLTGLPNRRALMEAVQAAERQTLALVIVDIDRFKRVNDTHGHLAGDTVIRSIGQSMVFELGALGQVARMGGEEFALLSSGVSTPMLVAKLVAFRERVESTPILVGGGAVRVTISAGVALRGEDGSFDQLFSEADRALYLAKTTGRNRIRFAPSVEALCGLRADSAEFESAVSRSA